MPRLPVKTCGTGMSACAERRLNVYATIFMVRKESFRCTSECTNNSLLMAQLGIETSGEEPEQSPTP